MSQRQATPNLLERAALDGGGNAQGHGIPYSRRVKRTYELRLDTTRQIEDVARLERFHGKALSLMCQALLDYALWAYEVGDLEMIFVQESDGKSRPTFRRIPNMPIKQTRITQDGLD